MLTDFQVYFLKAGMNPRMVAHFNLLSYASAMKFRKVDVLDANGGISFFSQYVSHLCSTDAYRFFVDTLVALSISDFAVVDKGSCTILLGASILLMGVFSLFHVAAIDCCRK